MQGLEVRTSQLIKIIAAQSEPEKRLAPPAVRWIFWLAPATLSILCGVLFIGVKQGLSGSFHDAHFLMEATISLVTAFVSSFATFVFCVPGETKREKIKWLMVLLLAVWASFLGFDLFYLQSPSHSAMHSIFSGYSCLLDILILGIFPGVLLFTMIRRGAPTRLGWTGVLGSVAALSMGAFGVQFTCSSSNMIHAIVWHYLPVLLIGGCGAYAGLKWLRW